MQIFLQKSPQKREEAFDFSTAEWYLMATPAKRRRLWEFDLYFPAGKYFVQQEKP